MKNKFKKTINQIKNSKGYISIETIVVAGLVLGIGAIALLAFKGKTDTITTNALNNVEKASNSISVAPTP